MPRKEFRKISLYIPTYNSGKYLKECLESVFLQTYKFSEVIVIDDCSDDDTREIAKKYKVKLILTKRRAGLANARNIGMNMARNKLVASVDSDVVLDPKWLENMMQNFNDSIIAGVGGCLVEDNKRFDSKWRKNHMAQNWGEKRIVNPSFLFGSNCIFRKSAIKNAGGYDRRYKTNFEDVDICRKLSKSGYSFIYDPNCLCCHKKKDRLESLAKSYYNWTFYGYPLPFNLTNLLIRLFFFNPYKCFRLAIKDIFSLRFSSVAFDFLLLAYNDFFDIKFYKNERH